MATFKYIAKDNEGEVRRGTVEAGGKGRAVEVLRERSLTVISLSEKSAGLEIGTWLKRLKKPSDKEKAVFTRQLATMMGAGLPLTQALSILRDQSGDTKFGDVLEYVLGEVQGGKPLSEAMGKFPDVFSETYTSLVESGEASGAMKDVLSRLAENLERRGKLEADIKGALFYPAIILAAMVGVGTLLMIFVIPKLKEVYVSFEAELPFVTQIFLGMSDFVVHRWWLAGLLLGGFIFAIRKVRETEQGKYLWARLSFKLPVFGGLYRELQLVEIMRTLSLLLSSGVPIVDSLDISRGSASNLIYRDVLATASVQIERGGALAAPFEASPYFPPIVGRMVAVG